MCCPGRKARLQFVVNQEAEKATGKGLSWERRSPAPSFLLWLLYFMQPNKESAREGMVPTATESTRPWKSCAWKQADALR